MMGIAPHQPKMWAKVKYSVVCIEERTVEIPVPCDFDPENPQQMLAAIEEAAGRLQAVVMSSDFKHEFDLKFKKPKIQVAYAAGSDGRADHNTLYRFEPLPVCYVEGSELTEVDLGLLDQSNKEPG